MDNSSDQGKIKRKKCYYELLQVDRKATQDEIKISYKKMALKLHPDKNRDNPDAKEVFQQLSEAYTTLSDPNERTWYDHNRDRILRDKDNMTQEDLENEAFGFNIFQYLESSCYQGYDDDENGFFTVYRNIIEKIKYEEEQAFQFKDELDDIEGEFVKMPGFGNSQTGNDKVIQFYNTWGNFITYKSFSYADAYDTRDGNNRWIRRQIEKENKKERKREKKEYLITIKKLIEFIKRKDPRWKNILKQQQEEEIKREKEKKHQEQISKEKKKQQLKRAAEEELKRWEQLDKEKEKYLKEEQILEQEKIQKVYEEDEYMCEICEKGFKTHNQFKNHKNSKIHKNNIKELLREVATEQEREILRNYDGKRNAHYPTNLQQGDDEELVQDLIQNSENSSDLQQDIPDLQEANVNQKKNKKLKKQQKQFQQMAQQFETQIPNKVQIQKEQLQSPPQKIKNSSQQPKISNKQGKQIDLKQKEVQEKQHNSIQKESCSSDSSSNSSSSGSGSGSGSSSSGSISDSSSEHSSSSSSENEDDFDITNLIKTKKNQEFINSNINDHRKQEYNEKLDHQKQIPGNQKNDSKITNTQKISGSSSRKDSSNLNQSFNSDDFQSKSKTKKKANQEKSKLIKEQQLKHQKKLLKRDSCQVKQSDNLTCKICNNEFDTRNKLFKHIKETGHTAMKQ